MTVQGPTPAGELAALKRRFALFVAGEAAAVVLGGLALVAAFVLRMPGALMAFAAVVLAAVAMQIAFVLAVRRDMKKGA